MARFGIPKIVFSDNVPQFSSAEFLAFAKFYNFQSKTVRAEKAVQIVKRLIKKSAKNKEDLHLALLVYKVYI